VWTCTPHRGQNHFLNFIFVLLRQNKNKFKKWFWPLWCPNGSGRSTMPAVITPWQWLKAGVESACWHWVEPSTFRKLVGKLTRMLKNIVDCLNLCPHGSGRSTMPAVITPWQWLKAGVERDTTVHFVLVCQRLFGDNFFYYLIFLAEIFMMCVNVFYVTRNKISAWSDIRQITTIDYRL